MPLSSPLDASIQTDAVSLAIVLAAFGLFGLGLNDALRRLPVYRRLEIDPVTSVAYGALTLVGAAVALMMMGTRSIPITQAIFLLVAVWGVACAFKQAPRLWRWVNDAPAGILIQRVTLAAAMAWTCGFWMDIFRSHVALPVAHDGIVHTAYYLRILESGVPTLGRVPIGFADVFGVQRFAFYPTGTHALMAIAAGFWGQWGVITHAGILKACFTLTIAALPWSLYWVLRRLMPRMPWFVGLAVVLIAVPGFRFPLEAAHEGGASRLMAHLVLAPIYADALLGRFDPLKSRVAAALLLGVSFLMHPSAFVTLAAIMSLSTICAVVENKERRKAIRLFAGMALTVAIAGVSIAVLLRWNGSAAEARDMAQRFSWHALLLRWRDGWTTLFDRVYGWTPWLVALIGMGFSALVAGRRRLHLSWRVTVFPIWICVMVMAIQAAQVVSVPGSRLLGGAFYDELPRTIEPLFEVIGLCLATALWCIWLLVAGSPGSVTAGAGRRRLAGDLAAAGLVAAALSYQVSRTSLVRQHIVYWDQQFQTARIGALEDLGAWITQHTEPDALLFYKPFDAEIWEAWTGRRGIFMYGECHANNTLGPCIAREALVNREIATLTERLDQPAPADPCLAPIALFNRPAYFLVETGTSSEKTMRLCRDATLLTTIDRHAVIRYDK